MADEGRKGFWATVLARLGAVVDLHALVNFLGGFTGLLYGRLDSRLDIGAAIKKQLHKPVPGYINWAGFFGGITFLLFIIQVVTGVLLAVYYRPGAESAYESVVFIMNDVSFGWLVRSVHRYAAELMILTCFIHMVKVYLYAAYKPPRELNWVSGAFLLLLTLTFGFTGYLLPWDQRAYWATTVGTQIAEAVPVVGKYLAYVLRGGDAVGGATLARFYAIHVVVLPWLMTFFLIGHFFMIRRQGVAEKM